MTASNPRASARGVTRSVGRGGGQHQGPALGLVAGQDLEGPGLDQVDEGSTARLPARRVASAGRPRMTGAAARARPMKGTVSPNRL